MQNKNREVTKKLLKPGRKLCLDLTAAEREIVLTKLLCLDAELEEAVKNWPPVGPLLLTLDDLAELAGHVAAAANHAGNRKLEKTLDGILAKIDHHLQHFIEQPEGEELAAQLQTELGHFAPLMFSLAEQAGINRSDLSTQFGLPQQERTILLNLVDSEPIREKLLANKSITLTCDELGKVCTLLAKTQQNTKGEAWDRLEQIMAGLAEGLMEMLAKEVRRKPSGKKSKVRRIAAYDKFTVQLTLSQRLAVAELQPQLADRLKLKEKNERACEFSPEEAEIVKQAAFEAIPNESSGMKRNSLRHIEEKLHDALSRVVAASRTYQFKITLLGAKPAIWRRIQVKDCTLDKLHEHIQTAMGWTNSHLHQFEIFDKRYGDPELLDDGFDESSCIDSTKTKLSDITPNAGKRFKFTYEYDFGDDWEHEVLFEGSPPVDPKAKYPLCLEGERACPPEDCGGVWGYGDFLEAIANPKHEVHSSMLEWIGGRFDPEEFDPKQATKEMKKGLPDWRSMR